ncbi:plasmid pRiA4b ORF-3 family protein [Gordonia sp. ABSL11-1]|uniref:plasmid pRiA4b ORF-3 family protein n=1 Tax=Gordonia sp. ABSL11-1 TaxID=3053924 RepID=UPI002572A5D4|nr:plasmid pRiA4b ORF-3 family protein [Gordonia sp. ABSL11-1]MDL9948639.1 plasmid pRiA4b ORF-3 family protein [Gordonia sp. ABSL11-1]
MSKKRSKQQQKRERRKAKRAPSRGDDNVVPLFPQRLAAAVPDGFREWVIADVYPGDDEAADSVADQLQILLSAVVAVRPDFDPVAWSTDDVDAMVSFLEFMRDREAIATDQLRAIGFAALMLSDFLVSTGRWSGSPDVPELARERIMAALGLSLLTTEIASADEELERAALLATAPLSQLTALLGWLGDGRPTTASRWLKPAAARELAAVLGWDMPSNHTSMSSFAPLRDLWMYAQTLQLIEVNTSRAWAACDENSWQQAPVEVLRAALTFWIASAFLNGDGEVADEYTEAVAGVVFLGCTDGPNTVEDIDGWVDTVGFSPQFVQAIHGRLALFVDEGWLTVEGNAYVVPEALRMAVVAAMPRPVGPGRGGVDASVEGELLLRVELEEVTPPVWRIIAVDASVSLADVHDILQIAFDWEDSHLHQFRADGERWMPAQALELGDWEDVDDERHTTIGEVLTRVGAQLTYEYDFGDGWTHVITVVDIADDPADLVAEVRDGGGMSPLDDVGGPPGWEDFTMAVSDPSHPRHTELREWAGYPRDRLFDATRFDVASVNRQLRRVFVR